MQEVITDYAHEEQKAEPSTQSPLCARAPRNAVVHPEPVPYIAPRWIPTEEGYRYDGAEGT